MSAVIALFNRQFEAMPKMLQTIIFQKPDKVSRALDNHIQIHFTNGHWVVSQLHEGTVNLYDSLNATTISANLSEQIQALYFKRAGSGSVSLIPVQKQPNVTDCGLYAIANTTSLAYGEAPEKNLYDEKEMRDHLLSCFEAMVLIPFPTKSRSRRKTKSIVLCI